MKNFGRGISINAENWKQVNWEKSDPLQIYRNPKNK